MHRTLAQTALGASFLALSLGPAALAQDSNEELRKEIEALKQGQQQIQKQLQEITTLLKSKPAAKPSGPNVKGVELDLGDNFILGVDTAKLTLVEFTDYQ